MADPSPYTRCICLLLPVTRAASGSTLTVSVSIADVYLKCTSVSTAVKRLCETAAYEILEGHPLPLLRVRWRTSRNVADDLIFVPNFDILSAYSC